jgi:putative Mn2+ efflux pump MntP
LDLFTIILIAVGLSMDALAVSIAKGTTVNKNRRNNAIILAALFGGFQALMPVIGWAAGLGLKDMIMSVDHWIAFGLLGFIGAKMIYESTKDDEEKDEGLTLTIAVTLAIATSIDALMVGLSFAFLETSILVPVMIIGLVTFVLCLVGFLFGSSLGKLFGKKIEVFGGAVLILIGIQILAEHMLS